MASADDLRRLALALPETTEAPHFELTSFRVAGKIFCTLGADRPAMLKFSPEDQANLVAGDSRISPVPGYWGQKGSTFVRFESLTETELAGLLRTAWATVAPKRLLKAAGPA
jgi:hypothetical protein